MNVTAAAPKADGDRFVVCDVALFYAERSGGIRTYLNEKARFARITGAFEHHLVIPGKRRVHAGGRHELPSLQLAASNGYRPPLGGRALRETLRAVRPNVVILHDPFWRPLSVTREAHRLGAAVVVVHHASPALHAAGIPGPDAFYLPALRRIYQHAYEHVEEPSFQAGWHLFRCWRGPSWINTAWLLVPALRRFGYGSDADRIVASCIELVERHGFREYYNPLNGEGLAARRFGRSTLLIDLLGGADGGGQGQSEGPFVGSLRDELRSMGAEAAGEAGRRLNRRAAAAAAAARRLRSG